MKEGCPTSRWSCRWSGAAIGLAAGLGLLAGCGPGIYDGAGQITVTETITSDGGKIIVGQAVLVMGTGTFNAPTQVTLRRLPGIAHAGAYGPVFEISVPGPDLVRQDATLELMVPFVGDNQSSLVLGALDPGLSLEVQQWTPISDSGIDPTLTRVTGKVQGLTTKTTIDIGAVVKCPAAVPCPAGQACNSGACQQCPTGSPCPS
jgi:hypothetical protein